MDAFLHGLWVSVLLVTLARLCRRRRSGPPVVVLPLVVIREARPLGRADDEAWLRRQLDGLGR